MNVLTIKEYDRLAIKDKRDLEHNAISYKDAACLESIRAGDTPVFGYGNRCLIAQQWVGVIELPEFSIEILPKLYGYVTTNDLRDVLVRMILVSRQSPSVRRLESSAKLRKNALSELLIETFLKELDIYCQSGLDHAYRKVTKNLDKVKGQIQFRQQLRRNILAPTRFYCRYSEFLVDCDLNRFFKTCLRLAGEVTRNPLNDRKVKELLPIFDGVKDIGREEALSAPITFNLVNARAETAYRYGRIFLDGLGATLDAGNTKIFTMLFDMNHLYELFIYRTAAAVYKGRVIYQKRGDYMISRNSDGRRFVSLRPDLTLKSRDSSKWIIDTKWKIPRSFAKESDVYQMNAYSSGIRNVEKVILLYPKTGSLDRILGYYTLISSAGSGHPLEIKAVDLMKCLEWNEFLKYFKDLINLPELSSSYEINAI